MSYVHPIYMLGRNFSFSLAYQNRYDFGREFNTNFNTSETATRLLNADFDQSGTLGVITPSAAVSLTDQLSIGISFNFWRSSPIAENDWEIKQDFKTTGFRGDILLQDLQQIQIEQYDDFSGENYVFGLLWNATEKLNIALRYDTAFEGEVDYQRDYYEFDTVVGGAPFTSTFAEKRKVKLPWTAALGFAYRFNDRFTMSLDASISDWSKSYIEDGTGLKSSLIDGLPVTDPASTEVKKTIAIRLGAEYAFIPKELNESMNHLFTLRGGLFYDEEPATGRPSSGPDAFLPGDGKPDEFWGATIGLGVLVNQRFNFDIAYQIRSGNGVNTDFVRGPPGFEEDVLQHRVIASTVIYF
jgi:long-subunit fatty acid transport protein